MKTLLFGTGDYYERYKKWFSDDEVIALLDNDTSKQNQFIDGIKVLSPEVGIRLNYDRIIILSFYVKNMKKQLQDLGVPEYKIYHFYDLHKLIDISKYSRKPKFYGISEDLACLSRTGKSILLLSHDLTLGGPAIALLHVAEVLVKHGYQVVYGSMLDGPLKEKLLEEDIPVIVDENLQVATMDEIEWVNRFSVVMCNTINYHVFASHRNTAIPMIWWLHDSLFFYDGIDKMVLQSINRKNLRVVSVGPVPQMAMNSFLPDLEIGRLIYGVEDTSKSGEIIKMCKDKVTFITIGYIEARKGQDILIQAIKQLTEDIRNRAIFYLVGQDTSLMAQQIKQDILERPEIVITGSVDRAAIDRLLDASEVMICPSREDPMPTVAAEAMMHNVPCIISDATGTAKYIQDGKDGFVFHSENVRELVDKINWCVLHYNELESVGNNARELYKQYFSMEVFEQDLLKLIQTI